MVLAPYGLMLPRSISCLMALNCLSSQKRRMSKLVGTFQDRLPQDMVETVRRQCATQWP